MVLIDSRRWDDGEPTGEYLAGTSVIGCYDEASAATAVHLCRSYIGRYLLLVGSRWHRGHGDDPGEDLLGSPVVLGVLDRDARHNPSVSARRPRGPLDAIFWHGSSGDEDTWRWYTQNRQHASYFGPVTRHRVVDPDAVFLDAETDEALRGLQGAAADAALFRIWREEGRRTLVVRGWEGGRDNLTVYLGDSGESEPA